MTKNIIYYASDFLYSEVSYKGGGLQTAILKIDNDLLKINYMLLNIDRLGMTLSLDLKTGSHDQIFGPLFDWHCFSS